MINKEELSTWLLAHGPWHFWVMEYGISHGRILRAALHKGELMMRKEIVLNGVSYFHGKLETEARIITIDTHTQNGITASRLSSEGGDLVVLFDKILSFKDWPPS